jgi:pyridinium-3,5-bisthiocarboxylic acid mononucleotide nickel chelatase
MKIAYLECHSGISGDMTLAALLDAGASLENIRHGIASLGLGEVRIACEPTTRKGFRGMHLSIEHTKEQVHRGLGDIASLIRRSAIDGPARKLALRIFERIAKAEAKVHGTTLDRVHFHEIGAIDSIVDIVGVSMAWCELGVERCFASPVPVGSGEVKIAHGLVPVPAPATSELLTDIPVVSCGLPVELTTPTGAAILCELVSEFGPLPSMQVSRIGYGAGTRELSDRPNLLRILVGHQVKAIRVEDESDQVIVLETNLDDISGEQIGFALEVAWRLGALDAFTIPIQMKKNRPGTLLTVICRPEDKRSMEQAISDHTGTLGIRSRIQSRYTVPRAEIEVETPWGVVRGKVSRRANGEIDFSPEYEDCSQIAKDNALRLVDVWSEVLECYAESETRQERTVQARTSSTRKRMASTTTSSSDGFQKHVNEHFQQAAFEDIDQFMEVTQWGNRSELPERESIPSTDPESPRDEPPDPAYRMYRWDSSPWME